MKVDYKNQKPSYKVPKRSWIRSNPRTFQILTIGSFVLTLFSKPLYDAFIAEDPVPHKSAGDHGFRS